MTTTNEHHEVTPGGYELHVKGDEGDYEVWFNLNLDYDGFCIGGRESRASAVRDACDTLERALKILRRV